MRLAVAPSVWQRLFMLHEPRAGGRFRDRLGPRKEWALIDLAAIGVLGVESLRTRHAPESGPLELAYIHTAVIVPDHDPAIATVIRNRVPAFFIGLRHIVGNGLPFV